MEDALTSQVRPPTDAVLTIRVIKSFPYRNSRNLVLPSVNLKTTTPTQLLALVCNKVATESGWRPFRTAVFDSLKVYTHAHGTKSMNLIINMEHDDDPDWLLISPQAVNSSYLWDLGIQNETELSVFNWQDYCAFKENPEEKW